MSEDKTCADKMAFENVEAAQAVATTEKFRRGSKVKPYLCLDCQLWHLSTDWD